MSVIRLGTFALLRDGSELTQESAAALGSGLSYEELMELFAKNAFDFCSCYGQELSNSFSVMGMKSYTRPGMARMTLEHLKECSEVHEKTTHLSPRELVGFKLMAIGKNSSIIITEKIREVEEIKHPTGVVVFIRVKTADGRVYELLPGTAYQPWWQVAKNPLPGEEGPSFFSGEE